MHVFHKFNLMDIGILQIKTSWIDMLNFYVQAKNSDWRTVFLFMCRHYWLHSQHLIDYLLKKKSASKKTIRLCREFDFRVVFVVWGSVCAFHYLCAAHSTPVNLIDLTRWMDCDSLLKSMLRLRQPDLLDPTFDRNKGLMSMQKRPERMTSLPLLLGRDISNEFLIDFVRIFCY